MRWPWRRDRLPSEDARHAVDHAHRALADAQALGRAADEIGRRADELSDRWREAARVNHVAEKVIESIKKQVRHT